MRTAPLLVLLALTGALVAGCSSGHDSSSAGAPASGGTSSPPAANAPGLGVHEVLARYNKGVRLGPQVPKDLSRELSSHDCSKPASVASDGSEIACDPAGAVYLLRPEAVAGHVASAKATKVSTGSQWYIRVALDATGTSELSDLTQHLVGSEIAITVDGEVVGAPVVYQQLTDGQLSILGDYTQAQATKLASSLVEG